MKQVVHLANFSLNFPNSLLAIKSTFASVKHPYFFPGLFSPLLSIKQSFHISRLQRQFQLALLVHTSLAEAPPASCIASVSGPM